MILITDDSSLHILGFVEGPDWKHYQYTHRDYPNGFFGLQAAYQRLKAEFAEDGFDLDSDPLNTAHLILYGEGGYSRYYIRSTGEIVLLVNTTRAERVAAARALDITVLE